MFPKRCDRGTVSYLEGERVPKNWGIVTEGIREVFDGFVNSTIESGGMKVLKFGGNFAEYFWKRCRDEFILLGKLVFDLGEAYFKL